MSLPQEKALLWALLQPHESLKAMQDSGDFTRSLMMMEECKTLPFTDIWAEYCRRCGVIEDETWFEDVMKYEKDVMFKRV